MFGGSSSPTKEKADTLPHSGIGPTALTIDTEDAAAVREKRTSLSSGPFGRKSNEDQSPGGDKRRRSSTVSKAASFFTNAKNSLHLSSSRESSSNNNNNNGSQTPLQKLGKMDPALSVPKGSLNNSAGESLPTPRSSFRVGVTEDRNRKCRRTMEDTHAYLYNFLGTPAPSANGKESSESASTDSGDSTHVVETDNGYFAIFDGHAGTFAAEWCGKKLHLILEDIMRKNPNTPVPELLDQTFTSADQQLEKLPLKNSGCTAATAVLRWEDRVTNSHSATGSPNATESGPSKPRTTRQRVLYTANVGDARIILCRNGKALRLSYDHKGSDENEGKRITNAGGLILNNRVNGVLAVTRALGDAYLKDLVTGHPYTTETVIQPDIDEFLILACDGLWDVCTDQEAVDLIRHIPDAQEASKVLVDHALARFSTDNLSCMVIRFDAERHKSVVERRSDPIGVEGDQSSAKKGGVSEADKIVEGARKSMANAEISDVTTGLDEKLKEDIVRQASNEEPGPELSPANDQDAAANSDAPDKPNIKDGEEEKKS